MEQDFKPTKKQRKNENSSENLTVFSNAQASQAQVKSSHSICDKKASCTKIEDVISPQFYQFQALGDK